MKGFDFFMACYRKGVDLPVRIFADSKSPINFYRPESICFINLEADEEMKREYLALLNGMDVSILAESVTDHIRDLTKLVAEFKPRHLVVLAGETFASWAPHRGWK